MDATLTEKIYKIACKVREWAEVEARLREFDDDLCGMCAIASAELWRRFYDANIISCIACGPSHFFNVVEDTLIDITATQFGKRSVEMHRIADKEAQRFYWRFDKTYMCDRELRSDQVRRNWEQKEIADVPQDVYS